MAYTKTAWTNEVVVTPERLNNLEIQYDEAVAYAGAARADNTKELRAEVVDELPATKEAGRMVLNSDNGFFYGADGSAWNLLGGGIDIKSYQLITKNWDGAAPITNFGLEISIVLPTPVSDYTKCICLVRGEYPYNLGFIYNSLNYPSQVVAMPFYAYLSDNYTLKLVPSYTEPDATSEFISGIAISNLSAAQRPATTVTIEVIEIDGARSIQFAQKVDTHQSGYYTGVGEIAGITDYTKTIVFYGGGLALQNYGGGNGIIEYKRGSGVMISNTEFTIFFYGQKVGTGGGIFPQNRKAAYYIVETF